VHQPGVRSRGGAYGFEVGDVDEVDLDAELLGKHVAEQSCDAHVDDVRHDRVVAGVEDGEERGVQGGHSGPEDGSCLTVVEPGQLLLQAALVRAVLAGVDEALVVGGVDVGGVFREAVGVRHHDGGADGAERLVGVVPAVDCPGVTAQGVVVVLVRAAAGWGPVVHDCSWSAPPVVAPTPGSNTVSENLTVSAPGLA
jgi:hypothetical protein